MNALPSLMFASVSLLLGAAVVTWTASQLALLAAAALPRRAAALTAPAAPLLLAVVVPAHDEELVLGATLTSLAAQSYPADCVQLVVVADNCTDRTADIARQHGAAVLERTHATERGKGYALNHAMTHLLAQPVVPDAFVVVDADTQAAPGFLAAMSARISQSKDSRGYGAWQGRYGVLNSGDGWRAALMTAAFDLVNHVKPLGRDRLGLSAGLKGNGMAFTAALAAALPWPGGSLTEDLDYGLELARRFNLRVQYVPEARVAAQMPATAAQAASQRRRWEEGRAGLVRERALPLLGEGMQRRSLLLLDAALDLLTPPLAQLGALTLAFAAVTAFGVAAHLLAHPAWWAAAAGFCLLALPVYILGGLRVAGAGPEAYAALLQAPVYALWKIALLVTGRKSSPHDTEEWVRTERHSLTETQSVTERQP